MRILFVIFLISLAAPANSQGMPEGMQEALQCMESLDQQAMEQMATEGKAMAAEIEALCKQGDEAAARKLGIEFALEIKDHELITKLQECGALMKKAMPGIEIPEMPGIDTIKAEAENICDDF